MKLLEIPELYSFIELVVKEIIFNIKVVVAGQCTFRPNKYRCTRK